MGKASKGQAKAEFWRMLEIEYVQGGESAAELAKRYGRSKHTVRYHLKKSGWVKKREKFRAALMVGHAPQDAREVATSPEVVESSRQALFQGFVETQVINLAQRYSRQAGIEQRAIRDADREAAKAGEERAADHDTFGKIAARGQALKTIVDLGVMVWPDVGPAEPPEVIFEAVLSERRVTHRVIDTVPTESDGAVVVDVTPEEYERQRGGQTPAGG